MGVLFFHAILTFPCVFWSMSCIPTNFNELDTTPACFVYLPISNLDWFFNKVERVVNMNFVSRDDNSFLRRTLLQV
ncbi:hypothetical protein HanRHA438_Chr11g0500961 [Helianthus annuus]|nr:hypothetical protein HanIR_Chr11g0525461 [Helianthus annuus]KAJ0870479.1 hypothetical protein HanRHA438_Chr11g0500961 [Helianthus annuus]